MNDDLLHGFENMFNDMIDAKAEFIPIISESDEELLLNGDAPDDIALLPLRGNVLFPGVVMPVTASRKKSKLLLKSVNKSHMPIGVVAQLNDADDPNINDLHKIGTLANVIKVLNMPDGSIMAILQGVKRLKINFLTQDAPFFTANVSYIAESKMPPRGKVFKSQLEQLRTMYDQLIKQTQHVPNEASFAIRNIESPRILLNFIASHLEISLEEKQEILEIDEFVIRANKIYDLLTRELNAVEVRNEIRERVHNSMDKQQRDYILSQQLRTIQEELGEIPGEQEIYELEQRAKKKKWVKEVAEIFNKEINKLRHYQPQSPDYSVQLNYLNLMLDLPWGEYSKDNLDLAHARKVLDRDHYGLEKVKERIIEYIAVLKLKGDMKSPILCLVGPPGVGKTSLGKSIASAINRKYIRVALGGLHDEAEIRGHRKTYIGATPGRILQNIKKAGTSNPVFVLDEIDKVTGMTHNGDPSSALLEVLDPEQNTAFHDNYLDIDYDLSNVMFIATANTLSTIQPALLDRMEVIDLSGYILEEKKEIAKRHLIPKQMAEHGLKKSQLSFSSAVLGEIINEYTREAGVRQLEKCIAKIIRHNAVKIVKDEGDVDKTVRKESLKEILGLPIHRSEERTTDSVGVVTGLAWTSVGGEILFIESSLSKGKGNLTMTGNLGDVMKESATLAYEYVKSKADELGIDADMFETHNVHIHVPEGATPKDGPSAGITIFTALVSAFTHRKVRSDFALTGEITLRGQVMPVGGIKEKILAAKRAKITDIVLCSENRRDIEDIDQEYVKGLTFHYVDTVGEIAPLVLI
ncbi:MAG: endopeptidase La [Bacteroidales bacterium]|nr:endopeptidase La [Bacteroidales bacterium]